MNMRQLVHGIAAVPIGVAAEDVLGIWKQGSHKAWVIHADSPFDPKGMILLLK